MDRHLAIRNTHKNVGVIDGESDAWDLDGNKITIDEELVTKEIERLQADYDAKSYARSRAKMYDPIPEQLDQIYHDIDGWKAKIKAVKDKYPKPT